MITKLILTFGILIYTLGVPILELNSTHVFNLDWTPHARIHEVWLLIINSSIGLYCLWLVWHKQKIVIPCILSLLITGGFLVAFILQDLYGGSMKYLDGSEKTLFGINIGVLGFGIVFMIFLYTVFKNHEEFTQLVDIFTPAYKSETKTKWYKVNEDGFYKKRTNIFEAAYLT